MKVVISGGGTGGHIYPALSIARQLSAQGDELLFVGSRHGPEGRIVQAEGIRFVSVPSGPIVGFSFRTLRSLALLKLGALSAYCIFSKIRPDVVVATGGYTSAGVAVAAWLRGVPVVIHEQNSVPGRTNLLLARFARRICVTFEESQKYFPAEKTILTGLPVRPEIAEGMDRAQARKSLGLEPDRFTVLIIGGSQGARKINNLILDAAPILTTEGIQVLHQVGQKNYEDVVSRKPELQGYIIRSYIDEMSAAYSAADLVVSRSGASTIAEITVSGLPAVLIPYPYAHAAHQAKNAEAIARTGAAIVIDESELSGAALAGIILDLAGDRKRLAAMAEASRKWGRPNATEEIVRVVAEVAGIRE